MLIKDLINKLSKDKFNTKNTSLVFNKQEWLSNKFFGWTEKEIDNYDKNGYFGTRFGVDCYVSRFINIC